MLATATVLDAILGQRGKQSVRKVCFSASRSYLLEEPRSALKENSRVGLVYMRLDPHLPKLYPRAHADVGACHERRDAYSRDLVLPRLGQGGLLAYKNR